MAQSDIERSILGAILVDNRHYLEAADLRPEHFSLDAHRCIFRGMRELAAAEHPIDFRTLEEELDRHGDDLEAFGGLPYLGALTDGVPDRPSITHYVQMLRTAAERQRAAKLLEKAQQLSEDPTVPTSALAEVGVTLAQMGTGTGEPQPPQFSEEALALRFSRKFADDFRYVARWGRWMRWDGTRWIEDDTLHVFDLARGVCRAASAECGDKGTVSVRLASKVTSAAVERLAQADRRHAATISQWDCDPWLLNTPNGTVDLRTGEIHKHQRDEYLTKITAVGPEGDCPLWLRFVDRVTGGDPELQSFLQRMVGYALTGCTFEHSLFFFYGTGANGKSVFLSTISAVLGDYAKTAPASTFTANATEQHPTDVAGLCGARFVTAIETEDGSRWAEAKIKSLTGGDKISTRFMRGDFFELVPEFKLFIAGNHKPSLRSVDEAMRRRLHLIPFTVTIPFEERDPRLGDKLRAEGPGILAWAIQGCLAWQKDGLNPPALVRDATADYLAAEDSIRQWLEENCIQEASFWTTGAALFSNYQAWCNRTCEPAMSKKRFTQALESRGFIHVRTASARGFSGIGLQVGMTNVTHPPVIDVTRARRRPI